eukprot:561719-Amphidinium_carterae.1
MPGLAPFIPSGLVASPCGPVVAILSSFECLLAAFGPIARAQQVLPLVFRALGLGVELNAAVKSIENPIQRFASAAQARWQAFVWLPFGTSMRPFC